VTLAQLLRNQLSNDEWRRVQSEAVAWMVANGSPYVDVDDAVKAWLVHLVRRTVA